MYLVDTNVVSEVTKCAPHPRVLAWLGRQASVAISAISVMELEYGIARLEGAQQAKLVEWLEGLLASAAYEVVPVNTAVARAAGQLKHECEERGRPRPWADLIIAATAQVTGAVVATRNTADFSGLGIALLNPFGD